MQNSRNVTASVMQDVAGRLQDIKSICVSHDCVARFYAVDPPKVTHALGHLEGWIAEFQEQIDALRDLADRLAESIKDENPETQT